MPARRVFGDYQTPADFAARVCRYLQECRGLRPTAILEPTCGRGNFLKASLVLGAEEYLGIEINPDYCAQCRQAIASEHGSDRVRVVQADIFALPTRQLLRNAERLLILGNPPWVTTSTLASLALGNLPARTNARGLRGIEAVTGAGTFDLAEFVIWQLLQEYRETQTSLCMLCKASVARKIYAELRRSGMAFAACDVLEFDAATVFDIHAAACVLVVQLTASARAGAVLPLCTVADFASPDRVRARLDWVDGRLVDTLAGTANFDGRCCFEWRQGIKHDCARVMELSWRDGGLWNDLGEVVQLEDDLVYPLVKSSMIKSPVLRTFSKYVLVTQKKVGEATAPLAKQVPKTWRYLNERQEHFVRRKSAIYRGAPPFALFGVGDYTFAPYKVAISGLYKQPRFALLSSESGKAVLLDDTCYFLGFASFEPAYVAMLLLNSAPVQAALLGMAFLDAKRPYTKKVLARLDFGKMLQALALEDLVRTERSLGLPARVTGAMYEAFAALVAGL